MLSTQKAIAIITEMDDDKRNAMIDELSVENAKYIAKILAKAIREFGHKQKNAPVGASK